MTPNAILAQKPKMSQEVMVNGRAFCRTNKEQSHALYSFPYSTGGRGKRLLKVLINQTACKPGSVRLPLASKMGSVTVIPLDRPLLDGSRDLPGRPGPASPASAPRSFGASSLFGLAPGGACHAVPVARSAVGSYPTLSPFPAVAPRSEGGRFAFCGAIPGVAPGGRYPPPFRRGARTFLDPASGAATARPSGSRNSWARLERRSRPTTAPLPPPLRVGGSHPSLA